MVVDFYGVNMELGLILQGMDVGLLFLIFIDMV
jgi:hypothetical protein